MFDGTGNITGSIDAADVSNASAFYADKPLLTTTYADTTSNVQYKYDEAGSVISIHIMRWPYAERCQSRYVGLLER